MPRKKPYIQQSFCRNSAGVSAWGKAVRLLTAASFAMASSPLAITALASDLIADPSAAIGFRPSITSSTSGVPVINITNPTPGGVSLNRFSHFNVGSEGVIHNNSLSAGTASLGGSVSANPNLSVTASTIVDEVTSSNTSTLSGDLEVFGASANVIVVNPNGITCSGCGVINIPRFTMTTGTPTINIDGTDIDFDVSSGVITINGDGLNGRDFSQIDLIARELLIQGAIYRTSRLDVIAGANEYDYEDGAGNDPNAAITEDGSAAATGSTYQIDASALSEMSAGKINIIGTDDGVGVRIQGNIGTTTGDVLIDADGNLLLEGSTTSEIDTILRTGSSDRTINVSGGINGGRDIQFDASGDISINALVSANRRVTVDGNGQNFTNNGQDISGSQMNIQNVDTFTNDDGDITAGVNDLVYEIKASDTSLNALAASIANQININPGFEGISANPTTDGSGVINIVLDDIAATAVITPTTPVTGSDEQTFTWASTGANTATLTIAGTIEANDSYKLSNSGDIVIGTSANPITTFTNTDSSAEISAIGGISIYTSGALNNQSGANITADRAIILNSSGDVVNQDATITGTDDVTLEGDTLTLSTDATKYTRAGGVLTLDWNQAGFDFDFAGEQIKGNTGLTLNIPDAFTNSVVLTMPGDITINSASVTTGQNIIAGDDIVITTSGDVENNNVIYANDATSGGNGLVIDAGGSIVNNANKSIYGEGDVVLVSDSFITTAYNSYIEAGDDLTLAVVTGETIADGGITGGTKVITGYIFNTEGQVTSGGDISIIANTFNNWRGYTASGNTFTANDITTTASSQDGNIDKITVSSLVSNSTSTSSDAAAAGDTYTITNSSTGDSFTYTVTGNEADHTDAVESGQELMQALVDAFDTHQTDTGQFDDVEYVTVEDISNPSYPYGFSLTTNSASNYTISFNDASSGSDTVSSSTSQVSVQNFGGWQRVRDWRSGGSDYELHNKTVSSQAIASDAYRANLYAGGDLTLDANNIRNRASTIQAGGNINITADTLNNNHIELLEIVEWRKGWGSWTAGWGYGIKNPSSPIYSWTSGQCDGNEQNCVGEDDADRYQYTYEGTPYIQAAGTMTASITEEVQTTGAVRAQSVSITATSIQNGLSTDSVINITSNQTNAVSLTPSNLDNLNALYSYDPSGSSQYLISSAISLPGQQLTASHLIGQLSQGAGSAGGLPFLADPFVENRLLRQASLAATGVNFVLENVEANDDAQREALYNNAANFANSRNDISLGTALTENQQAQLTAPVLWYVTENVGGNEVLVPTLYLPTVDNLEISPLGEIVAENNVVLQAEETISNTGTIEAGGTAVLQAQDITNQTLTTRGYAETGSGTVGFEAAAGEATISGGSVILITDSEDEERGNITNTGGSITGTDEEGRVLISASGDVVNEALVVQAVEDVEVGNLGKTLGRQDFTVRDEFVSGTIGGAGDVTIISEGEVFNTASAIAADGNVLISATEGFTQTNLSDTFVVEDSVNVGGGGSTSTSSSASSEGEGFNSSNNAQASASAEGNIIGGSYREGFVNQSASVSGANVTIYSSEGDITSIGSSINSSGETILFAEDGSISLQAASIVTESRDWSVSQGAEASAQAGGQGADYNATAQASTTTGFSYSSQESASFIESSVGGENVTLIAGQDVEGIGAQLNAANNLVIDAGNDVTFTAAQESLSNTSVSLSQTSTVYASAGTTSGQLGTPDANAGVQGTTNIGVGGGTSTSSLTSNLNAGGNVVINSGNNIALIGTDINAGSDVALAAVNDVTIQALAEDSSSFGVGISASAGFNCSATGACGPTASASLGVSTSSGTTFTESNVNAGGNFSIQAGGAADLTGVNLTAGEDATIVAASVNIASAQDTLQSTGFGLSSNPLAGATGSNATFGNESDSPLSINFEQTDALVTTNQAQVNVGGNLNVVATEGDAQVLSIQGQIGGDAVVLAEGDVTIGDNQDRVDTTSVNVDLTVETGLEDAVGNLAGGIATAIETGDTGALVGAVPGVNRVAQTIAAIESGDATQIAGVLGGPLAGAAVGAIDQYALDGQISANANPTGSSVGNDILNFTGGNQPSSGGGNSASGGQQALALANSAQTGDLSSLADLQNIDGDIDARLGVTVTETSTTTSVGSNITVEQNLIIDGNNVNIVGSDVSVGGDTTLIAENTINLVAGENTFDSEAIEAGVTVGFDVINQDVKVGVDGAYSEESSNSFNEGSLTSGGTLTIQSGGDTNVLSNTVQATDINVNTGGDLNIQTLQAQRDSQTYAADVTVEVGITGDSGAGEVNFEGGIQSGTSTGQQASFIATNDLNINSANDVNVTSAIVGGGNNANINAAGDITFTANIDQTNAESFGGGVAVSANQQGEGGGGGGSGSVNFNYQNDEADTVASQSVLFGGNNLNLNAGNDITLADTAASGDNIIIVAENDVNILTTQSTTNNFGVGGNLEVGGSSSGEGGDGEDSGEFALGFNFNDGDSATINEQGTVAAGSTLLIQSGGNTNIIGSEVSSEGDAAINVGGDLTVTTLQDTVDQTDVSGSIEASGSSGEDSGSGAGSLEFNLELEDSSTSNVVAGINAGGNLQINTGGDTTLTGAVVEGGTVDVNIGGDLTVTSLQDTADNVDVNLAAGSGGEDGEATSFNFEAGVGVDDIQQTNVIAGITATDGDLNANVGGTTTLTGALIASTAEGGTTNLTTENLVVADLADSSLTVDAGVNLGLGSGDDQSLSAGANVGVNQTQGTTVSTIGQGNLVITSGETVEVNRDLTQAQTSQTLIDFEAGGDVEVGQNSVSASGTVTVDGTTVSAEASLSEDGASAGLSIENADGEVAATEEEGDEPTAAETALALAQAAVANAGQSTDSGPRATTEQMNTILGQFRVGADVTTTEAQAASANVFNGGEPASSPALEGLSPAQKVQVLQASRVWLTREQQTVLDRTIQQIITGEAGSPVPAAEEDS